MKKYILLVLCAFCTITMAAQSAADSIKISNDGLSVTYHKSPAGNAYKETAANQFEPIVRTGNTYIMGNRTMNKYEYAGYLRNVCPQAFAQFNTGYTISSVGWGFFAGGLGLSLGGALACYYGDYSFIGMNRAAWLLDAGYTLTAVSIPLLIFGYHKQHSSVHLYNAAIGDPYFSLELTDGGFGVVYHF